MKDYSIKSDFNYFLNPENNIKFGVQTTYHDFNIGNVKGNLDTMNFAFKIPKYYSMEHAAYISNIQNIAVCDGFLFQKCMNIIKDFFSSFFSE